MELQIIYSPYHMSLVTSAKMLAVISRFIGYPHQGDILCDNYAL